MSMFQHLDAYAGDPILSLNEDFQKDPWPGKINLSIGIYFDNEGRIPVLDCVRQAEAQLLAESGPKPYLPIEGSAAARRAVQALLFGAGHLPAAAGVWPLDGVVVARTVLANAVPGLVFGALFARHGIECAIAAHFLADLGLHVVPPLLSG
mgnify:CR=1 FL=1